MTSIRQPYALLDMPDPIDLYDQEALDCFQDACMREHSCNSSHLSEPRREGWY